MDDDEEDPYDSHPVLPVRLTRLGRKADTGGGASRPLVTARSLLRDPDQVDRQLAAAWLDEVAGGEPRDAMTWQEAANELAGALEVELESDEELPELLEELLGAVAAVHLVREHGWRWAVRWSRPLSAVDRDGDDRVREVVRERNAAPLRELLQLDATAVSA